MRPNMTKLLPANVSAASNSSELAMKFVLAATLAEEVRVAAHSDQNLRGGGYGPGTRQKLVIKI